MLLIKLFHSKHYSPTETRIKLKRNSVLNWKVDLKDDIQSSIHFLPQCEILLLNILLICALFFININILLILTPRNVLMNTFTPTKLYHYEAILLKRQLFFSCIFFLGAISLAGSHYNGTNISQKTEVKSSLATLISSNTINLSYTPDGMLENDKDTTTLSR
jgi:hypothetical protein